MASTNAPFFQRGERTAGAFALNAGPCPRPAVAAGCVRGARMRISNTDVFGDCGSLRYHFEEYLWHKVICRSFLPSNFFPGLDFSIGLTIDRSSGESYSGLNVKNHALSKVQNALIITKEKKKHVLTEETRTIRSFVSRRYCHYSGQVPHNDWLS